MKKILFIFNVDNAIDIITNSSSELFVLSSQSQAIANEMIESVYPDYRNEYQEVVALRDADTDLIQTYISWVEHPWHSDYTSSRNLTKEQKRKKDVNDGLNKAQIYGMDPATFYTNWDTREERDFWYANISDEGLRVVAKKLDPEGKIFLLISHDENPNFDYQEELCSIADRYHLG